MGFMRWFAWFPLGLAVVPIARSLAFVPHVGPTTNDRSPRAGASVPYSNSPRILTGVVRINAREDLHDAAFDDAVLTTVERPRSRVNFVENATSVAAFFAAGAWGVGLGPATADSTGKFSTKATARKRYLPRIVKLVSAFQQLKKEIADKSVSSTSPFFVDILPDGLPAMDLFGSSMKRGEYPDSTSKGLQQLAKDFGTTCNAIGKSLGKEGGADDVARAYEKASVILEDYLKSSKLDPMGSDIYI